MGDHSLFDSGPPPGCVLIASMKHLDGRSASLDERHDAAQLGVASGSGEVKPMTPDPHALPGAMRDLQADAGSDSRIETDCRSAIDALGHFPLVQLLVNRGWVRVHGSVSHAPERWKVEDAVARVAGVVGVNAQLGVESRQ